MGKLDDLMNVIKWGSIITATPVVGTLAWRAIRHAYDDIYKRVRAWQRDRLTVSRIRKQNQLHAVRLLRPDERGRQGIAFDGRIYRNLDNMAIFEQTLNRHLDPVFVRLDAIQRTLLAMQGLSAPHRALSELEDSVQSPHLWPDVVHVEDLFRDRTPTIHDLVIGVTINEAGRQETVSASLHDLMHVLEVGASGWGKSTWLRAFLWQIARAREHVGVVAIDINGSEFNALRAAGWGKLRYPVARKTPEAVAILHAVSGEIRQRKSQYEANAPLATKLDEYNESTGADLPPWVVVIDEGTNLLNQEGLGHPLRDAVQTARQYGIYVLLAGQSATHRVIDTQVRDQFSTRLCFRVSPTSSRVVLNDSVAGELRVKGRAWIQMTGRELIELQGPYVSREAFLRALDNGGPQHSLPRVPFGTGPTADVTQILDLHAQGLSPSAICHEVYGYSNGNRVRHVQSIIQQHDDSDNDADLDPQEPDHDTESSSSHR